MNIKSYKKIKPFIFLIFGLSLLLLGFQNANFFKYKPSKNIYTQRVAYIDLKNALYAKNFKVCDSTYIVDYYNRGSNDSVFGRTEYISGKNGLRKEILSKYTNNNYGDSGYLNFRFIVNCKGEAGAYIIHENDLDLHPKKINPELVNQLTSITVGLKEWRPNFMKGKERDSYMYISYRIENGDITEILP